MTLKSVSYTENTRPHPVSGERIDWLLVRGLDAKSAGICDYHTDEEWPSDHVPVYADLTLD